MNILRSETIDFVIGKAELIAAIKRAYPKEFLLRKMPTDMGRIYVSFENGKLCINAKIETGTTELTDRRDTTDEGRGAP